MLAEISSFIAEHHLLQAGDKVIVACSGGSDSMALLHLLHNLNYSCVVAHVNYQLRGEESHQEHKMVTDFAQKLHLTVETLLIDKAEWEKYPGQSTQMAARKIRYTFLEALLIKHNAAAIAVGTHMGDNLETQMLNFTKGSGLKGLRGILPKRDDIIRPILGVSKNDTLQYCAVNKIPYRHDSSNESDKYERNFLRLHVIPEWKKLQPQLEKVAWQNAQRLQEYEALISYFAEAEWQKRAVKNNLGWHVSMHGLFEFPGKNALLWMWLEVYGFEVWQIQKLAANGIEKSKTLLSSNFKITGLGNGDFLLTPITETSYIEIQITGETEIPVNNGVFSVRKIDYATWQNMDKSSPNLCILDPKSWNFELVLRTWKAGDKIKPAGLKGRKKVSDVLQEKGLNSVEKQMQLLLCSKTEILWILGIKHAAAALPKTDATVLWCCEWRPAQADSPQLVLC
jgi:tRNA(Ile)-lysidine synthase